MAAPKLPPHTADYKIRKAVQDYLEGVETNSLTAAQRTAVDALTAVATADASDLATAQALANANKVAINAIIAALQPAP